MLIADASPLFAAAILRACRRRLRYDCFRCLFRLLIAAARARRAAHEERYAARCQRARVI